MPNKRDRVASEGYQDALCKGAKKKKVADQKKPPGIESIMQAKGVNRGKKRVEVVFDEVVQMSRYDDGTTM